MASTSDVSEGPILTVLTKRIHYLRQQLTGIDPIEVRCRYIDERHLTCTKPEVVAMIEELEKLRLPLTAAVDNLKNTVVENVNDVASKNRSRSAYLSKTGGGYDVTGKIGDMLEDLMRVIYFGSVFNTKIRKGGFEKTMSSRKAARIRCLKFHRDLIDNLNESDLDLFGKMSELLVPTPADSRFSHQDALRRCVGQAKKWVAGSKEWIGNSNVTYAELRGKLAKITESYYYYYKFTPKTKPTEATEAAAVVLTVLTKRIHNLRKKHNRIYNKEFEHHQPIYKEQKNLHLLPIIIKELQNLCSPLIAAVDNELKIIVSEKVGNNNDASKTVGGDDVTWKIGEVLEELLKVIYFGSVFNVKMTKGEFEKTMLTRNHERICCLTYRTDDDLSMTDLDLLAKMSEMLVSGPADLSFSPKDALRRCVEHAKKWVAGSEERIDKNSNVTYAELRGKLAKITVSDYYKYPEVRAPADVAAEAADVAAEAAADSYAFVQAESEVKRSFQPEKNHIMSLR